MSCTVQDWSVTPAALLTRSSEKLMKNLLKDNYPILFEGLHTCFFLDDKRIRKRRKIVINDGVRKVQAG